MNADDLIAEFKELADVDPETRIFRTREGDAERVRLVPSYKKNEVQRFKALAADAATLFDLTGPSDPMTRWLCFVLDHAPELVEDCKNTLGHSLGDAIEHHDDGTERRVPFIAQTLSNAASASALVVRRCRRSIEPQEAGDGSTAVDDVAKADAVVQLAINVEERRTEELVKQSAPQAIGDGDKSGGGSDVLPPEGEWSAPLSLTEIARRITGDPNARGRKVKALLERSGLEHIKGHQWRVRLDTVDSLTRQKIEYPKIS